MLQLNLDSNCDYVQIFGAVIGHLEAEIFEFSIGNGENLGACRDSDKGQRFQQVMQVQQPVQYGRDAAHISWAA